MDKVLKIFYKYPIIRGMMTYSVLYPTSNLVQQSVFGSDDLDLTEVARFAVFGSCWVAPTLYTWVKIAGRLFPATTVSSAIGKALVEQVTYGPFAITTFYTGMNALQGKKVEEIGKELKSKFWPTYKAGCMYWPIVQTINFALIPERNRVSVVGAASLLWVTFLSYMKHKEVEAPAPDLT